MNSIRVSSIVLLVAVGILAVIGGFILIVDSSGESMRFSLDSIKVSPFSTYLIPGILLFLFLGVLNFVAAYISFKKLNNYFLTIVIQGGVLFFWLNIQLLINPYFYYPYYHIPLYIVSVVLILFGLILIKQKTIEYNE